jgi:N-glycosylase/DNA lyase
LGVERLPVTEIPAPEFDLAMTLGSGQVFHWEKIDGGFYGTIGDEAVCVEQCGNILRVRDGEAPSRAREARAFPGVVARYFALDHPLAEICGSFPNDPAMKAAASYCRGLRIIRQPKWECLATFICSSMKQVAHIRQISKKLRERFGEGRRIDQYTVHTFPSAARLARSSEGDLRECALGYRARNLLATARLVASGEAALEEWSALSDADLRARLCGLPGVGAKVANCVMLFAYERLRAFPIDVWIERVLREKYFPGKRKVTAGRLREFAAGHFGEHGGYAQQYLFHHARTASRKSGRVRDSSTALRGACPERSRRARNDRKRAEQPQEKPGTKDRRVKV